MKSWRDKIMIYKEEGFELKGFTLGELYTEGEVSGMVVGIDDSDVVVCDVAILVDSPTNGIRMSQSISADENNDKKGLDDVLFGTLYGLEKYADSDCIIWVSSCHRDLKEEN
jgi:hypothetical protein